MDTANSLCSSCRTMLWMVTTKMIRCPLTSSLYKHLSSSISSTSMKSRKRSVGWKRLCKYDALLFTPCRYLLVVLLPQEKGEELRLAGEIGQMLLAQTEPLKEDNEALVVRVMHMYAACHLTV